MDDELDAFAERMRALRGRPRRLPTAVFPQQVADIMRLNVWNAHEAVLGGGARAGVQRSEYRTFAGPKVRVSMGGRAERVLIPNAASLPNVPAEATRWLSYPHGPRDRGINFWPSGYRAKGELSLHQLQLATDRHKLSGASAQRLIMRREDAVQWLDAKMWQERGSYDPLLALDVVALTELMTKPLNIDNLNDDAATRAVVIESVLDSYVMSIESPLRIAAFSTPNGSYRNFLERELRPDVHFIDTSDRDYDLDRVTLFIEPTQNAVGDRVDFMGHKLADVQATPQFVLEVI